MAPVFPFLARERTSTEKCNCILIVRSKGVVRENKYTVNMWNSVHRLAKRVPNTTVQSFLSYATGDTDSSMSIEVLTFSGVDCLDILMGFLIDYTN